MLVLIFEQQDESPVKSLPLTVCFYQEYRGRDNSMGTRLKYSVEVFIDSTDRAEIEGQTRSGS